MSKLAYFWSNSERAVVAMDSFLIVHRSITLLYENNVHRHEIFIRKHDSYKTNWFMSCVVILYDAVIDLL